ncbi:MAG: hypothetical protein Q4B03_09655 [Lachnospiraceae bacterium]|nr:hypothetical protein [Lachnospiraceae bacterium]
MEEQKDRMDEYSEESKDRMDEYLEEPEDRMDEYPEAPRRRRTPKKPEHPIREWISDYLRYFILFGGILLILLITVAAVRLITGRNSSSTPAAETGSVSAASSLTEDTDNSSAAADDESEDSEENSETESQEAIADEEDASEESVSSVMTEESADSEITTLISAYFAGLAARDPEAVRACVDTLSEEDAQQVAENSQITSYTDVQVYTFDGIDASSKTAFVSYSYTVNGSDAVIPALTQFYAYDTGNGDWRLASDPSEEAVQQRIQELVQTESVQNLIIQIQVQYDQVLAEHPELQ